MSVYASRKPHLLQETRFRDTSFMEPTLPERKINRISNMALENKNTGHGG